MRRVGIVLVVALAIEVVNFFFLGFPIDVGYPPNTPWYIQLIGLQWVLIHLPALRSMDMFEKVFGCRNNNIAMACNGVDRIVLFVGGYLTTVFVGLVATYAFHWITLRGRRQSTNSNLP